MTQAEKKAALDLAWAQYRAASQAIPRGLPFAGFKRAGEFHEGFLEKDERLWRAYRERERQINEVPVTRAA